MRIRPTYAALLLSLAALVLSGCGGNTEYDSPPDSAVDLPEEYADVAYECGSNGEMIYVTWRGESFENSSALSVITDDPRCAAASEPPASGYVDFRSDYADVTFRCGEGGEMLYVTWRGESFVNNSDVVVLPGDDRCAQ